MGTSNPGVPGCPTSSNCTCTPANANASDYSAEYKSFLTDFYIAQVTSPLSSAHFSPQALIVLGDHFTGLPILQCSDFRTWDTENATQCNSLSSFLSELMGRELQETVSRRNCELEPKCGQF